jgi:hypothetical protein
MQNKKVSYSLEAKLEKRRNKEWGKVKLSQIS